MYTITYAPEAKEGLAKLKRSEPASFKKAVKLLNEIADHPKTGTGHPEQLKGQPENRWSRMPVSPGQSNAPASSTPWRTPAGLRHLRNASPWR